MLSVALYVKYLQEIRNFQYMWNILQIPLISLILPQVFVYAMSSH